MSNKILEFVIKAKDSTTAGASSASENLSKVAQSAEDASQSVEKATDQSHKMSNALKTLGRDIDKEGAKKAKDFGDVIKNLAQGNIHGAIQALGHFGAKIMMVGGVVTAAIGLFTMIKNAIESFKQAAKEKWHEQFVQGLTEVGEAAEKAKKNIDALQAATERSQKKQENDRGHEDFARKAALDAKLAINERNRQNELRGKSGEDAAEVNRTYDIKALGIRRDALTAQQSAIQKQIYDTGSTYKQNRWNDQNRLGHIQAYMLEYNRMAQEALEKGDMEGVQSANEQAKAYEQAQRELIAKMNAEADEYTETIKRLKEQKGALETQKLALETQIQAITDSAEAERAKAEEAKKAQEEETAAKEAAAKANAEVDEKIAQEKEKFEKEMEEKREKAQEDAHVAEIERINKAIQKREQEALKEAENAEKSLTMADVERIKEQEKAEKRQEKENARYKANLAKAQEALRNANGDESKLPPWMRRVLKVDQQRKDQADANDKAVMELRMQRNAADSRWAEQKKLIKEEKDARIALEKKILDLEALRP